MAFSVGTAKAAFVVAGTAVIAVLPIRGKGAIATAVAPIMAPKTVTFLMVLTVGLMLDAEAGGGMAEM